MMSPKIGLFWSSFTAIRLPKILKTLPHVYGLIACKMIILKYLWVLVYKYERFNVC